LWALRIRRRCLLGISRSTVTGKPVQHAGFAMKHWARTATRLLADQQVLDLISTHQAKQLDREQKAARQITVNELFSDLDRIAEDCITSGPNSWSVVTLFRATELRAKLLGLLKDKPEPQTEHDYKVEVKFHEGPGRPTDSSQSQTMPPIASRPAPGRELTRARLANFPNSPQPTENAKIPSLEKQPIIGATRTATCQYHGDYVSTFRKHPSGVNEWDYCSQCSASANRDLKWLDSLIPGDAKWRN